MPERTTILIVDDDPDVLSSLRLALESRGYRVVTAGNAAEGLDAFLNERPSLVFCDIMMERIDAGIRLARDIRERDARVPIYLVSDVGRITASTLDIGKLGCSGAIQKPFDTDGILKIVKDVLGG